MTLLSIVIGVLWVAALIAAVFTAADGWVVDGGGWRAWVLTPVAFALLVGGIWVLMNSRTTDPHVWRGGAGPNTVCTYSVRQESMLVGKVLVPQDITYTVCTP